MSFFGPIIRYTKNLFGIGRNSLAELEMILRNQLKAAKEAKLSTIKKDVEEEVRKEMQAEIEKRVAKLGATEITILENAGVSFREGYKAGLRVAYNGKQHEIRELLTWFSELMTKNPTEFGFGIGYIEGLIRSHPEIIMKDLRGYISVMNALRKTTHVEFRAYLLKRIEENPQLTSFYNSVA